MIKRAIWWIKRDFRLLDNEAFSQALEQAEEVLPLFVFERDYIAQPDISPMHVWAWQEGLQDLKKRCQPLGGDILISKGHLLKILTNIKKEWDFSSLYSHEETGNGWTYQRDMAVQKWCLENGVNWVEPPQNGVIRRLKKREDRQPIIRKRIFDSAVIPTPLNLKFPEQFQALCSARQTPKLEEFFDLNNYPDIQWDQLQKVSETQAHHDLESFLTHRGKWYSGGISSPNTAFTSGSRLSVHLAWGTLSLRYVFQKTHEKVSENKSLEKNEDIKRWARSLRAFESRLHWHCHFIQRLETSPHMEFKPLNRAYYGLIYDNDTNKLEAWEKGMTGFPMIDACMRCLNATGFINFRMRSMLVSFACFGLHLDWRVIHPHLAQVFLDYEAGIHLSQLQMQAGIVGINTIRVYSPTKQISDQDPECIFIKRWIPELRDYSPEQILSYESVILGEYPAPIVDFKTESKRMKDQVFSIRKSLEGKVESKKVLEKHGSRKTAKRTTVKKAEKHNDTNQLKLF